MKKVFIILIMFSFFGGCNSEPPEKEEQDSVLVSATAFTFEIDSSVSKTESRSSAEPVITIEKFSDDRLAELHKNFDLELHEFFSGDLNNEDIINGWGTPVGTYLTPGRYAKTLIDDMDLLAALSRVQIYEFLGYGGTGSNYEEFGEQLYFVGWTGSLESPDVLRFSYHDGTREIHRVVVSTPLTKTYSRTDKYGSDMIIQYTDNQDGTITLNSRNQVFNAGYFEFFGHMNLGGLVSAGNMVSLIAVINPSERTIDVSVCTASCRTPVTKFERYTFGDYTESTGVVMHDPITPISFWSNADEHFRLSM